MVAEMVLVVVVDEMVLVAAEHEVTLVAVVAGAYLLTSHFYNKSHQNLLTVIS